MKKASNNLFLYLKLLRHHKVREQSIRIKYGNDIAQRYSQCNHILVYNDGVAVVTKHWHDSILQSRNNIPGEYFILDFGINIDDIPDGGVHFDMTKKASK